MANAKVIVLANQKGGVGKTTSTLCIGCVLEQLKFKVLYVDLDRQCNTTKTIGADINKNGSYNLMQGVMSAKDCTQFINNKHYIISASNKLALIDDEIHKKLNHVEITSNDAINILNKALEPVKYYFDFILVDTPPNLNFTTLNAINGADYIIMPCYTDMFSIDAINDTYEIFDTINASGKVGGILLTKYSANRNIDKFVREKIEEVAKYHKTKVFNTSIRNSIAIVESQYINEDISEYAPKCNAYLDYINVVKEMLDDFNMLRKER